MGDLKFNVLRALAENKGFLSGEELAKSLGVSRTAVWKSVEALKKMGYQIDAVPKRGYTLLKSPELLLPYEIRLKLKTKILGKEIVYFKRVSSTNDVAKDLASKGAPEGLLVLAEEQTKGRGRMGRSWFSPLGGLWFTLLLRPTISPEKVPLLALMLGVGVARGLSTLGLKCRLKWPNDVLINGKKVCGILTELDAEMDRVNYVIAGIGINVNNEVKDFPSEFKPSATTVKEELGREVYRVVLLTEILKELESMYNAFLRGNRELVLNEWRRLSSTLGRRVKVVSRDRIVEGEALDVSKDGALIIRLKNGSLEEILSGDCLHLGEGET